MYIIYGIRNPIDEHIDDLHKRSNVRYINVRRKKQVLTCYWRNISKGTIVISNPARQIRSTDATTIYLPKPKTDVSLCDHIDSFKLEISKIL